MNCSWGTQEQYSFKRKRTLQKTMGMISEAKENFMRKYAHHATPESSLRLIVDIAKVLLMVLTAETQSTMLYMSQVRDSIHYCNRIK